LGQYWTNMSHNIGYILFAIFTQYWIVHTSTVLGQY